jgi:hypothetical protein
MWVPEATWASIKRVLDALYRFALTTGAFLTVAVGLVSMYTNSKTLENIRLEETKYQEEGYSRYGGSLTLAIHTLGEANNKPYEIGQSTALVYLTLQNRLMGNVTLNGSAITIEDSLMQTERAARPAYYLLLLRLTESSLCGTEIGNWTTEIPNRRLPTFDFSYSLTA